jgi:hypothetical protein
MSGGEFIAGLGGAAAAWPLAAHDVRRIRLLWGGSEDDY